jgi:uncharacterized protein YqgV (UPF0045/DUF77 family)
MFVTAEISYYPLTEAYEDPVNRFIGELNKHDRIEIKPGMMSTLVTGDYQYIMSIITETLQPLMESYPSVFTIKLSNSCQKQ